MSRAAPDKISALAAAGATFGEIAAALGRPLTQEERTRVQKIKLAARLRRKSGKKSTAKPDDRMKRHRAAKRDTQYAVPANLRRRRRLEKDLAAWLKWYLPEQFPKPWANFHLKAIRKLYVAITQGGWFAFALPRGSGKTTLCRGAILWGMLCGHCRYILLVGATSDKSTSALRDIKMLLRFSDRLAADYPEVCGPIRGLEGVSHRTGTQTAFGKPTSMTWKADRLILPDCPRIDDKGNQHVNPAAGSILDVDGITGDIRGHVITLATGEALRPDVAICDDPQTKISAKSPEQCRFRLGVITEDIAGSAGPGSNMSVIVPCTVIQRGDLADQALDTETHPDFRGERMGLFESMPENMDAWTEGYEQVRRKGIRDEDGGKAARSYYIEHRETLAKGAIVSWDARETKQDVDAIQCGMNQYLKMGREGFFAEYQNEPIDATNTLYDLNWELISSRVNGHKRYTLPGEASLIIAATDINHYGLHWAQVGYAGDCTGWIPEYGREPERGEVVPKNVSEAERDRLIFDALTALGEKLASLPARPMMWGIDRGYAGRTVHRFCASARLPFACIPMLGRAGHTYRIGSKGRLIGHPYEHAHFSRLDLGPCIIFDADHWREIAQRAWLANVGAPGSLSVYGDKPLIHREFAEQIAAEKLLDIATGDRGKVYRWTSKPGAWHDWGDAVYLCYAAAAIRGLTSGGAIAAPRKKAPRKRRRVTHVEL